MAEFVGIRLTWQDSNINKDGFNIYRSLAHFDKNSLPAVFATVDPTEEEYLDTSVIIGAEYFYMLSVVLNGKEVFYPSTLKKYADLTPGNIGDFFEGGYYIGNVVLDETYGGDEGVYAIIMAPASGTSTTRIMYKNTTTTTPGTQDLKDGLKNSYAAIQANSATSPIVSHPAVEYCVNYTGSGYTDWYLPSRDELKLYVDNNAVLRSVLGFASNANIWSSTEHTTPSNAYSASNYDNSSMSYNLKTFNSDRIVARPVRRIKIA